MIARTFILIALAIIAAACPFQKETEFTGRLSCDKRAVSPKGVTVCSGHKIDPATLPAVDRGLDHAFWIASQPPNNYSGFKTHPAYTIWLFPWNREKCSSPSIYRLYEHTSVYDQGEYDRDPRPGFTGLCFAGLMLRKNISSSEPRGLPAMVIVDDPATIERVTWFEAEHNILLEVDMAKYMKTSALHNHPILGYGPPCECVTEPCPCSAPQKMDSLRRSGTGFEAISITVGDYTGEGILSK